MKSIVITIFGAIALASTWDTDLIGLMAQAAAREARAVGAAQALDCREFSPGKGVTKAREIIRRHVEFLDIDRPLHTDHTRMQELVKSCEILEGVEEAVGNLE